MHDTDQNLLSALHSIANAIRDNTDVQRMLALAPERSATPDAVIDLTPDDDDLANPKEKLQRVLAAATRDRLADSEQIFFLLAGRGYAPGLTLGDLRALDTRIRNAGL